MNIFKMYKVTNEVKERLNRELHFNVVYNYDGDKNSFTAVSYTHLDVYKRQYGQTVSVQAVINKSESRTKRDEKEEE